MQSFTKSVIWHEATASVEISDFGNRRTVRRNTLKAKTEVVKILHFKQFYKHIVFSDDGNGGRKKEMKNYIDPPYNILKEGFTYSDHLVDGNDTFRHKIIKLYNQSKKQIFIAFDKEDTFYDVTHDIVHSTKVIELHENGGKLFGWSRAKKAAREKQIDTETGVIEES